MKGQFEISDDMLKDSRMNIGDLTRFIIGQHLNNPNHNIGWFARKRNPVSGNMMYLWDDIFTAKITKRSYINYLLSMKDEGYELGYNIE